MLKSFQTLRLMKTLLLCAAFLAVGLGGALAAGDKATPAPIPAHLEADREIEAAIVKGLLANPNVFAAGVRVRVAKSVVTLEGRVKHRAEKKAAEKIARAAPGVREVKNELKIPAR